MRRIHLSGMVLLCALVGVAVWFGMIRPKPSTANTTIVAYHDVAQRVTIAGTIAPIRQTIISAPYNGYVKKLYVSVGQAVKAGDPIVSVVQSLRAPETVYPLRAPYAGTVVSVPKSEGEYVSINENREYIVKVDDLSAMYVEADVPEIHVLKLKKGQATTVRATSITEKVYQGEITDIALAAKPSGGSGFMLKSQALYPVRIKITNPDAQLRTDMSAIVDVIIAKRDHVLALPHQYIHQEGKRHYVVLKNDQRREVKLGLQNEMLAEVSEGLAVGDVVRQVDFM